MLIPDASDDLLAAARTRALQGSWVDVRALLVAHESESRAHAELVALRAEADLRTGRPREARRWLEEMLPMLELSGDRAAYRRAMNLLGVACVEMGETSQAEDALGRALELGRIDGDDLLVARATNNLGAIADMHGRREAALALYQLAIPAYQRLGDARGLAESYHNMAISFRGGDRLPEADEYERRAIEFAREASNRRLEAMAGVGRAEIQLRQGDARLAEVVARRAAREFAQLGDPIREADAARLVGAANLALGRHAPARASLERAVSLAREHDSALIEAESLRARAELQLALDDSAAARADASAALAIYLRLGALEAGERMRAWMASAGI